MLLPVIYTNPKLTPSSTPSWALWPRTTTPCPTPHCWTVLTRPPHYYWTVLSKIPWRRCWTEGTSHSERACETPLGVKLAYCCWVVPALPRQLMIFLYFLRISDGEALLWKKWKSYWEKRCLGFTIKLPRKLLPQLYSWLQNLLLFLHLQHHQSCSVKSIYLSNRIVLCNSTHGLRIIVSNIAAALSRATTLATESYASISQQLLVQ